MSETPIWVLGMASRFEGLSRRKGGVKIRHVRLSRTGWAGVSEREGGERSDGQAIRQSINQKLHGTRTDRQICTYIDR